MDANKIDFVIYHGNCSDGFGSAWAAWKRLGNKATYHAGTHGEPPPDVTGKNVAILDFSYDRDTIEKMQKDAESLIIIDHHKSAMIALDGIEGKHIFKMEHSGCILAWNFFHPGDDPPLFLQYIEDRDLWKFELPWSREFSAAFDLVPFRFKEFDKMLFDSFIEECKKRGSYILPYSELVITKSCSRAVRKTLDGHDALVVNATHWACEIGARLAPDCEVALVWFWDHKTGEVVASLRSFHDDTDCSVIAKKFGGGGHPTSSGFRHKGNIEELFDG